MMQTTQVDYEEQLLRDLEDPEGMDAQLIASLQGAQLMNQEAANVGALFQMQNSLGDFDEDEGSVDSFNENEYDAAVALWGRLQPVVALWVLLSVLELGSIFLFGIGPAIMGIGAGVVYAHARKNFGVSTKALIVFYLGCAALLLDLWSLVLDLPAFLGIITCRQSKGGLNFVCKVLQNKMYVWGFTAVIVLHTLVSAYVTYHVHKITQMLHAPIPPPAAPRLVVSPPRMGLPSRTSRHGGRTTSRTAHSDGRSYALRQ